MSLLSDVLYGVQQPQIVHLPPDVHSLEGALEAIELAESVGLMLDESQKFTLRTALGERVDHTWAAFEVADFEPRQNGKGDTLEAREIAGLWLFGESLQIHTAHEFSTANEAFLRMANRIDSYPDLSRKVRRIRYGSGEQAIELRNGARLKYRARTGGAGRGFAGADLVGYDEAQELAAEHVAASLPTLSTSTNPQVWYSGSAGYAKSTMAWRLRIRALRGDAGRLAYVEHTAEQISIDARGKVVSVHPDPRDKAARALANPAYNYRITDEYMESEHAAMGDEKFLRERLGVWDPLPEDTEEKPVKLPADKWAATATKVFVPVAPGEVTLGYDVTKDGLWSTITIGADTLESPYVETIEHRQQTGWLPARLVELVQKWKPIKVGCNGAGPAGATVGPVLAAFAEAGIDANLLHQLPAVEYKQACGGFYNDVIEGRLRRPEGQGPLDAAAADASERSLGDAWAWDIRSTVPISPITSATIARALLPTSKPKQPPKPARAYSF